MAKDFCRTFSAASSMTAISHSGGCSGIVDDITTSDNVFANARDDFSAPRKFVYEEAYKLHPIFPYQPSEIDPRPQPKPTDTYDAQRAKLSQTRSARLKRCGPLNFQTEHFETVILAFQQSAKGEDLPEGFSIRSTHTWDQVIDAAHAAEAKVQSEGSKNIFKKAGRGFQSYALAMSPWLDLIPNGSYTSTLCGSLKIAFNVAHRMKEKRVTIIETFRKVPETVKKASERLQEHPDDEALFDMVTQLYYAVLMAIEGMIKWLLDTPTRKRIGAILKQPLSNKPIDDGLSEVETRMEAVLDRATTLQSQQIGHIESNIKNVTKRTERIDDSTQNTQRITGAIHPLVDMTSRRVEAMQRQLEAQHGLINVLHGHLEMSEWRRRRDARILAHELRDIKREVQASRSEEELRSQCSRPNLKRGPSSRLLLSQERLKCLLNLDSEAATRDTKLVKKVGCRSKISFQSRGHWLLHDTKFRTWLTADETKSILVDGNGNGLEKISVASYVCALLIESLQYTEPVITLSYFCGMHANENDSLHGPLGLMRSLTGQLLGMQRYNLDFINTESEQQLQKYNLDYLLDLFRLLLEQVPSDKVLFCIIDGISFYERYEFELKRVIGALEEITANPETGPVFKLLLASPLHNRCAKQYFSRENHIVMPAKASNGQILSMAQIRYTNEVTLLRGQPAGQIICEEQLSEEEGDYEQGNFGGSDDELGE